MSTIRKPIKIDINTRIGTMGRFARAYVQIDLTKPLFAKFWLKERWNTVEYKGLQKICFVCGRYGNQTEMCPTWPSQGPTITNGTGK